MCPPAAVADLIAEPGAPTGNLTPAQVRAGLIGAFGPEKGEALFEWLAIRYPIWARQGWARAEEVKAWCVREGH